MTDEEQYTLADGIVKVNTAAVWIITMKMGRAPAFKAFNMALPGIPVEEQEALLDRFEDLWEERERQVKKALEYLDNHYDFVEKEESE